MFTGIVEEVGRVLAARYEQEHPQLTIACQTVLDGVRAGDSIAVEGVCLTVECFGGDRFTVGLMPETLRRTALGTLRPGAGSTSSAHWPPTGGSAATSCRGMSMARGRWSGSARRGPRWW